MAVLMKKRFFRLPYNLLLLTSFVLAVMPLLFEGQSEIIYIFNTSIFIASEAFLWIFACIFLSGWIIYLMTGKFLLTEILTWIHISITITIVVFWITLRVWGYKYPSDELQGYLFRVVLRNTPVEMKLSLLWKSIFIISQLVYVVNLAGGFIKKKWRRVENIDKGII
jgi:hypothetical protein